MFTLEDVLRFTGGSLATDGDVRAPLSGVATDSRIIRPGQLFVAYKGDQLDGHDFAPVACRAGAGALLVQRFLAAPDVTAPQIIVADPRAALARLANRVLARSYIETIIGVTGSAGKTTTREMTASVLNTAYPGAVLQPTSSYNTDTGLSMTILNALTDRHRFAVLEMGAQHIGEIAALCRLAPPHIGIVTNVGAAHLEFFGSLENVARAKGELIEALPFDGLAVLNSDDPYVRAMVFRSRAPAAFYGLSESVAYSGRILGIAAAGMTIVWRTPRGAGKARLQILGRHNLLNALAVTAVGEQCGVASEMIQEGLERFLPVKSRLQALPGPPGSLLIDDSYNANRVSMLAGLAVMQDIGQTGRRFAVLGDMYELGAYAEEEHRAVGAAAAQVADFVIAVGTMAKWIAEGALTAGLPAAHVEYIAAPGDAAFRSEPVPAPAVAASRQQLAAMLRGRLQPGDVVLVKAARGMRFDYLVNLLRQEQVTGQTSEVACHLD